MKQKSMVKQKTFAVFLIGVMAVSLFLSGCQAEQNDATQGSTKNASDVETESDSVLSGVKDQYYMLPISYYKEDMDKILSSLIEDYDSYKAKIEMTERQVETSNDGVKTEYCYTLETGGPAYAWNMNDEDYIFNFDWYKYTDGVIDNSAMASSVTDTEKGKELSIAIADLFDVELEFYQEEVMQMYDINNEPAELVADYEFRQIYQGVPLSYGAFIYTGGQELYGPTFRTVVDGDGVCMLGAFALYDIGEPIQTYYSKEFISLTEVQRKIESYCTKFNTNIGVEGYEMTATIQSGEVVYIPYLEKNELVLIPAYELIVLEDEGEASDEIWKVHYIVDVFTGYVYYRSGFDVVSK